VLDSGVSCFTDTTGTVGECDNLTESVSRLGAQRIRDQRCLIGRAVTHGMNQRQRWLSLIEIITYIFASCLGVALLIEDIVDQLYSDAKV